MDDWDPELLTDVGATGIIGDELVETGGFVVDDDGTIEDDVLDKVEVTPLEDTILGVVGDVVGNTETDACPVDDGAISVETLFGSVPKQDAKKNGMDAINAILAHRSIRKK